MKRFVLMFLLIVGAVGCGDQTETAMNRIRFEEAELAALEAQRDALIEKKTAEQAANISSLQLVAGHSQEQQMTKTVNKINENIEFLYSIDLVPLKQKIDVQRLRVAAAKEDLESLR